VKTAGEILSALFDERFLNKAQGYSKFFDSWKDITEKNGIAAAGDHSKIKDLEKGIVLIEMDHPGWKQIIQTKQSKILNDFRIRFPQLDISGISLILGMGGQNDESDKEAETKAASESDKSAENEILPQADMHSIKTTQKVTGLNAIKDEDFKETLKKLGQTIAEREKR